MLTIKKAMTAPLQKGGVPAAPSGTATLLRLSPNHRFYPRATLAVQLRGVGLQTPVRTGRGFKGLAARRRAAAHCTPHCNTCVAPDVRAVLI